MKKEIGTGITFIILLISLLLIGVTTASVIIGNSQSSGSLSEDDLNTMINDIVNDVSTYIKISEVYGKYYETDHGFRIQRIGIPIKLLYTSELDLSQLTIELNDGNQLMILHFNDQAASIQSRSLFDHGLWSTVNDSNFSILVVNDDDQSINNYHTFNKNTDNGFLVIRLSPSLEMKNGDELTITLVPSLGSQRTVHTIAPLPTNTLAIIGPS